ncbi:dolichol-phosphate mannosyltransferase subunit-like protein, partial [Leptotrombidium deliense]
MTRLLEFLSFGFTLLSIWLTLVLEKPFKVPPNVKFHVLFAPLYALIIFGLICLILLLYRVFTFNNCSEAYNELKQQIVEAREDLKRKGFNDIMQMLIFECFSINTNNTKNTVGIEKGTQKSFT